MPYQAGRRLPSEQASKLGHLEVLKSPLVIELCRSFEAIEEPREVAASMWTEWSKSADPLTLIFAVDGSIQTIQSSSTQKEIAFIKTARLRLDQHAISKIDKDSPHPFALRDILSDSAVFHATALPLRNIRVGSMPVYHAVRRAIFDSVSDPSLEAEPLETLKWLLYNKWSGGRNLPEFECPHCGEQTTMTIDSSIDHCRKCKEEIFITDSLGFHQEMSMEGVSDSVATAYMLIHETLLLFTAIRNLWQHRRASLKRALFIKDGPLAIRAQYSKLVRPIRDFLEYAFSQGSTIHLVGQEKSGRFFDHLQLLKMHAPNGSFFIPGQQYIREEIQFRPSFSAPYGYDTNYGSKVFLKLSDYHSAIVNIPTGQFLQDPKSSDLLGFDRILATLPLITSSRFEGALMPVELANNLCSLSTYPSAKILSLFADSPS